MNFQPNSVVRLLSGVPLALDKTNQRWFDTVTQQTNYFVGKSYRTYTEYTYQRKDKNIIAVEGNAETLYNCNYLMFQNTNFGSKWFYGYITNIEYRNPETTWVHYQLDPFQTWMFQLQYKQSFVEREHVARWNSDGTPAINTIDEGLNYGGEYRTVWKQQFYPYGNTVFMLLVCKNNIGADSNSAEFTSSSIMSGVPTPLNYFILPFNGSYQLLKVNGKSISFLGAIFKALQSNQILVGNAVSITILPYLPLKVTIANNNVTSSDLTVWEGNGISVARINDNIASSLNLVNMYKYGDFPKYSESKLLMYPYSYTELTDYQGNSMIVKNEYVDGNNLILDAKGGINAMQKTAYVVTNYRGATNSLDNGIINQSVSEIPILDDYTAAYLQGNKNSLITGALTSLAGNAFNAVTAGATGNPVGAVGAGIGAIDTVASLIAKRKDIDNRPPNISSQGNNAVFDYGNNIKGAYLVHKTIMPEYANMLTGYFNMYGYKVNQVKVPNLHTRQFWNYVKTVDCNILGNIPQDDLEQIRSMFDKGVTLWHTDDVGNYSLANNEI